MSSQFTYNAYVGFWINWAKGPVLGSTLTLTSRNGSIFLAFLVMFVNYAGSQSWNIGKYFLHRHRLRQRISAAETNPSHPLPVVHKPENGLYYQEQIVLRNEGSDIAAACQFLSLACQWRSKIHHALRRSSFLFVVTTLHAAGWVVAGIFVSQVVDTGSPAVLIDSTRCGYANLSVEAGQKSEREIVYNKILSDMNNAWSYTHSCYVNYTVPLECMMPTQQLFGASLPNTTCPFPGLCLFSDSAAFSVDSGLVNSNLDLGINAPDSNQINYHRVTTCAPLNTTGFRHLANASDRSSYPTGDLVEQFDFGPNTDIRDGNATFEYDTHGANATKLGYQIYATQHLHYNLSGYWFPISQLNHSDADITLIFLSANSIRYGTPIDDPIFAAHRSLKDGDETYYSADDYVSVLGCAEQHEYCLPQGTDLQGNLFCTGLSSAETAADSLDNLYDYSAMNDAQWDTAHRISMSVPSSMLYWVIVSRLAASLNASATVLGIYQTAALPNNQWQTEVLTWLAGAYAYLQQSIVQYASGQSNYDDKRIIQPRTPYERAMCNKQILRIPSRYASFSFLGVALIIVLGTIIIVIGSLIEHIAVLVWPRMRHNDDRQRGQYYSRAWNLDNKFQLQRMAFEGQSRGNWESSDDYKEIPRTVEGEKFEYFAIEAPGRPPQRRKRHREKLPSRCHNSGV